MSASIKHCANCGATIRFDARFCDTCGQPQLAYASTATGLLTSSHELKLRYRITEKLGQGGFGAIYKVEDMLFSNAIRAVKEMGMRGLNTRETQEAIIAFKHEAMLLANLSHPNLPRIYDHFEELGRWYLVMDYIEGETLAKHLEEASGGKLPVPEVLQIGLQLCTVLDYLHGHQPPIIFRDLKPDNVMLTDMGQLYLIDFGIARFFKPGQAKDTVNLGTPGYASPEQYGRMQTTVRSDVYSLGATLYHLISGINPGLNPFLFQPLGLNPRAPGNAELETLIMQMLEMHEDKRPASADVVKQELERIQHIQQVAASKPMVKKTLIEPVQPAPIQPLVPALKAAPITANLQPNPIVAQDGSGEFTTISEAIRHSGPGAYILVQKGIYRESLVLDKAINLIGNGPKDQIILESSESSCIVVQTKQATIRGLTIRCLAGQQGELFHALDVQQGQPFIEDCQITSTSAAAIAIHNPTTKPTIRYCKIQNGSSNGLGIYDYAEGIIEECEIFQNRQAGVSIATGANPIFRQCKIHTNQQYGIFAHGSARGTFEDCEIHTNHYAGTLITSQSSPLFLRCRVHDNWQAGAEVQQDGKGSFQDCEIGPNGADNVLITTGSAPYFYLCKIHDGELYGVAVQENGKGIIEYSEITANKLANILISSGGNPLIQHNKITHSLQAGIAIHAGGRGTIENCTIIENAGKALDLAPGNAVTLKKNQLKIEPS